MFKKENSNGLSELKFLVCDISKDEGSDIQKFLFNSGINCVFLELDMTNVKKHISAYLPDVIITGNYLFNDSTGIQFIRQVKQSEYSQIIIWASSIDEQIMSEIFKADNLHFVKKSENKNAILETIRKVKPVILTNEYKSE